MVDFPATQRDVTADGPPFLIDRHGDWFHGGERIQRADLIELFASILRRTDDGAYWLWHPGERCRISVADVPFVIEQVEFSAGAIVFKPRFCPAVTLDAAHALQMQDGVPYVHLGRGLQARCSTAVYYALVDHATQREDQLFISSAGAEFMLGSIHAAA